MFMLIILIAGRSVLDEADFSLTGIVLLGGWTYWVAALGAAARVYQHELFRADESTEKLVV